MKGIRRRKFVVEVKLKLDEVEITDKNLIAILTKQLDLFAMPMQILEWVEVKSYDMHRAGLLREMDKIKKRIPPIDGPNY